MVQSANITKTNKVSVIWVIPILAMVIGLWMLLQYQLAKGIDIDIIASDAEGIVAGKTEIRVRSVTVGLIKEVSLSENNTKVHLQARINPRYQSLLKQDTLIWVVKPRVDLTGVSGLGTLLSGFYVELQPGTSADSQSTFTLLPRPPQISNDIPGKRFLLKSADTNVLEIGTGVFYNNYQVGQIETARFDISQQEMKYGLFIHAPYDELVTERVLFWQRSGVEINLSADGVKVKTGSISQILQGGIAFRVPERESRGELATESTEFPLSTSYEEALESRFDAFDYVLLNFKDSIRGLRAGAPVEFRGIRIGSVVESPARLANGAVSLFPSEDSSGVPVLIRIEYQRINDDATVAEQYWNSHIENWVAQGLRASIKPGNLLTGANYIDIDLYPDSEPKLATTQYGYQTLPTISSGFSQISNQVSSVLSKMNNLDLEGSISDLSATLNSIETLSRNMDTWLNQSETQQLPSDMIAAIDSLQLSMKGFDKTMRNYDANSQFMVEVNQLLQDFKDISRQLRPVARSLNEQPNMLIFDKRLPADISPPKGN